MNDIESKIIYLSKKYKDNKELLLEKIFLLIKDNIVYKFGDWRLDPNMVFKKKEGMCTTKSRCLFEVLFSLGFEVYYKILRINAREVFGKFTIKELTKFLSNNSIHVYIIVKLDNRLISLDVSLDRDLEERLEYFHYQYDKDWNIKNDYVNFIDKEFILSESNLLSDINIFLNKKIKIISKFKFFISNVFLDYLRLCDIQEIKGGIINKNNFLKWIKKRNYFQYFIIKILTI